MKKYAGFFGKIAKFGFYIVLFLCISAIGISGYVMYLARNTAKEVKDTPVLEDALELPFPNDYRSVYSPADVIGELPPEEEEITPNETPKEEKPSAEKKDTPPQKTEKEPEKEKKTPQKASYTMAVSGSVSLPFSDGELIKSRTMDDWRIHEGVDIKAEKGRSVLAIADGEVEKVESDSLFGNTVTITHTNGLVSIYANLADDIKVKKGESVKAGQEIGFVGESAVSEILEEPHLHLEVISDGKHIDPLSLFPEGEE